MMKQILFVVCLLAAVASTAVQADSTVHGHSSLYYTDGGPWNIAEADMWRKAFGFCQGLLPVRSSEVSLSTKKDDNGRPVAAVASATFYCTAH